LHDLKLAIESSGETQFFVFVQMLYYTCARPVELCRLRISDIRENTILFRSENSKNKKAQHVMIPPQLQVVIEQSGLRSFPPNYFVFSATGKPGAKQIGEKHFYKRQVALLKKLGYNDAPYTLYSYKHTAVCQMYMAGIDIKSIQAQCRHSDIKQTDTYLKDLGLIRNDEVMNQFPDF
jgi:integrase